MRSLETVPRLQDWLRTALEKQQLVVEHLRQLLAPRDHPGWHFEVATQVSLGAPPAVSRYPLNLTVQVTATGEVAVQGRLEDSFDQSKLVDEILQHLRKMLNVHRGNVPLSPLYGMPDFNELAAQFPDAIVELQRAIQTSIALFEPRLAKARVRHVPDDDDRFNLRFEITAYLVPGMTQPALRFESVLDTSGHISFRR